MKTVDIYCDHLMVLSRRDGRIDWLPSGEVAPDPRLRYKDFMSTVDTLVMDAKPTKRVGFSEWPYGTFLSFVLSSRALNIPKHIAGSVESMSCAPAELFRVLAKRGATHLYIDGGVTIQRFLKAGLIQQITITRIPVLIGSGISLFGKLEHDIKLHHIDTRHFPSGFVQSKYEISA